jgi:hypothetical protein
MSNKKQPFLGGSKTLSSGCDQRRTKQNRRGVSAAVVFYTGKGVARV